MRALYSSHIACFQLGSRKAWKGDLGIGEEVVTCKLYLWLAFTISTLERVTIGCCEVAGGGGGVVGGVGVVCGDGVDSGVGGVDYGFVFGLFMVVFIEDKQIITLLSALRVEDDIFWDMQMKNVMNLNQMLVDNDVAYDEITTSCAESENTSSIMLGAGFKPQNRSTSSGNVIRVLKVVNVSGLEHLVDCLIFPRKGERLHTDEALRSDLDGDLYFVTLDDHLIPPSKQSWLPMEYTTVKAKELPCDVRHMSANDLKHNGRTTFIEKAWLLLWTKAPMRMSSVTKRLGQNNGNNKKGKIMENMSPRWKKSDVLVVVLYLFLRYLLSMYVSIACTRISCNAVISRRS
nr:RNA-dependent RNA polymerase 6 [Tanacetum cinerariifolium]